MTINALTAATGWSRAADAARAAGSAAAKSADQAAGIAADRARAALAEAASATSPKAARPAADAQFAPYTLAALMSAQGARPSAAETASALIDGALSLTELRAALPGKAGAAHGADGQGPLARKFAKLDADGDGQLSLGELQSAAASHHLGFLRRLIDHHPAPAETLAATPPAPPDVSGG